MVETQQKWYLPAPRVLGWHIGVWNLLGVSAAFFICVALADVSRASASRSVEHWVLQRRTAVLCIRVRWLHFGARGVF